MHGDVTVEASKGLSLWTKASKSPLMQTTLTKIKPLVPTLLILAGPAIKNIPMLYNSFVEKHNIARNVVYYVTGLVTAILSIIFFNSPEFKNFVITMATNPTSTSDNENLSNTTFAGYAYAIYLLITHTADFVTDLALASAFACYYGDEEFHLAADQAELLAQQYGVTAEDIKSDFKNRIKQLRDQHFATGANESDLRADLKAMMHKVPAEVEAICNEHDTAFNDNLVRLATTNPAKLAQLSQFKRVLGMAESLLEEGTRAREGSGAENPLLERNRPQQPQTTTYGAATLV